MTTIVVLSCDERVKCIQTKGDGPVLVGTKRTLMVLNKKSRMISFRLTAKEYTDAVKRCEENGHRSVSALARIATLGAAPSSQGQEDFETRELAHIRARMSQMQTDLDLVLTMFAGKNEPVRLQDSYDDLGLTTDFD